MIIQRLQSRPSDIKSISSKEQKKLESIKNDNNYEVETYLPSLKNNSILPAELTSTNKTSRATTLLSNSSSSIKQSSKRIAINLVKFPTEAKLKIAKGSQTMYTFVKTSRVGMIHLGNITYSLLASCMLVIDSLSERSNDQNMSINHILCLAGQCVG